MSNDIEKARQKAEEIAKEYNPEGLSPFPYERITAKLNDLNIYTIPFGGNGLSGFIAYDKESSQFNIFVDRDKPETRRHFTMAHELGHYFLHQEIIRGEEVIMDGEKTLDGSRTLFRGDGYNVSEVETEANNFAASLIMPEELVRKTWNIFGNVEECAKVFNVSILAMSIRLEVLNLISD